LPRPLVVSSAVDGRQQDSANAPGPAEQGDILLGSPSRIDGEGVMIRPTEHPYIVKNDEILSGEPIVKGTRVPVRAIVETWRMGVPPEAIPQSFPHITVAQVFDALSYFSDHMEEIKRHILENRITEEFIDPRSRNA
jgi:uncharacterized protein (DUF433 family)